MIGTELAASPYMPGNGRAYLLVGTGSKFEYFQSGYSGAGTDEAVPVEIILASKDGAYSTFYKSDKDNAKLSKRRDDMKKAGLSRTQLEAFTDGIRRVYDSCNGSISSPHQVFRQPLPTSIVWDGKEPVVVNQKGDDKR